jgi:signal transduction histidine kinase
VHVQGDRTRLEQLVWNLLENALRYTQPGGRVELRLRHEGDQATLTVSDTGVGIAAEHLPRLFERFYRVDKARSRSNGGTGLGLSIVKRVAETHGGSVAVSSALGQGTIFTVTLPASAVHLDEGDNSRVAEVPDAAVSASRQTGQLSSR